MTLNAIRLEGNDPLIDFKGYSYSRVTNTYYEIFNYEMDTSIENHSELSSPIPFPITGREVIFMMVSSNKNNTVVRARVSGILTDLSTAQ